MLEACFLLAMDYVALGVKVKASNIVQDKVECGEFSIWLLMAGSKGTYHYLTLDLLNPDDTNAGSKNLC